MSSSTNPIPYNHWSLYEIDYGWAQSFTKAEPETPFLKTLHKIATYIVPPLLVLFEAALKFCANCAIFTANKTYNLLYPQPNELPSAMSRTPIPSPLQTPEPSSEMVSPALSPPPEKPPILETLPPPPPLEKSTPPPAPTTWRIFFLWYWLFPPHEKTD